MYKHSFCEIKRVYQCNQKSISVWCKLIAFIGTILLGAILGYGSEWLEYSMHTSLTYQEDYILYGLIYVFNNYSIWIFTATLIAYHSWSPLAAGAQVFSFLTSMCIGYFIPKYIHYGYSITMQFILWGMIALFSIIPAAVIWLSRYLHRIGIVIKALPISAIWGELVFTVYHCIDYYSPIPGQPAEPLKWLLQPKRITQLGIYILFIVILIFCLAKRKRERLQIAVSGIPLGLVFALLFSLIW